MHCVSSVGRISSRARGRGNDVHLVEGLAHLVVQPFVVELVELHGADDRLRVFEQREAARLWRRSAQGGARQPTRRVGNGRLAGPARGRRAAPACEGWGRKNYMKSKIMV